jgi:alkylated DNA repair dioxygenase AlkB
MIQGLTYIPEYLTEPQAGALLAAIDAQPWLGDLKRRVQHYGYKYDYKARAIDQSMYLGPLPDWANDLAQRLHTEQITAKVPDQLIVNEYEPGQGISAHVDCVPCFGDTVVSISLGSACNMDFTHDVEPKVSVPLEPGSAVIMTGPARYDWRHSISSRKTDVIEDQKRMRSRRVSLTFRNVIMQGK